MTTTSEKVPEQFQNIERAEASDLDYYSLAYLTYYRLLDKGAVTYHNKVSKERVINFMSDLGIEMSDEDFYSLCSTIRGSKGSESLFGVYKERDGKEYKVDLLRVEKKELQSDEKPKNYMWIQFGDNIRGFPEDGNYRDDFRVGISDHTDWATRNSYGEFMSRVTSDKVFSYLLEGDLDSLRDRPDLFEYMNKEKRRLLNPEEDFN